MRSRAPVSRSASEATPTTSAPAFRSASTAVSTDDPVVEVSSTASTLRPATSGPSISRCRPCFFASPRTMNASSDQLYGAVQHGLELVALNHVYGPEPQEGIASFQEKRPADWRKFRDGQGPEPA